MKNLLYRTTVSLVTLISASSFLSASDLKEREDFNPRSVSSTVSSLPLTKEAQTESPQKSSSVLSTVFSIFKSLSFWGRASSTPAPQEKKEEDQQFFLAQPKPQEVQGTPSSLGSPQETPSAPASLTESIRIPDNFFTEDWASQLTSEDKAVLKANNMSVQDLQESLRFAATLPETQLAAALSASAPTPLESTPDVSTVVSSSSTSRTPTTIGLKEEALPPVKVVTVDPHKKASSSVASPSMIQIPEQFKEKLSQYAQSHGRTLEDLMASIIMVSNEPSTNPEKGPQPIMQGPLAKEAPEDLEDSRITEEENGTEDSVETYNGSDDDQDSSVSVSEDTGESDSEDGNEEEKAEKQTNIVITLPAPNLSNPKDRFLRYITNTDDTLMPLYDSYFYKVKVTLEDKAWIHRTFPGKKLVEFYENNPTANLNFTEVRNGNNQILFTQSFN